MRTASAAHGTGPAPTIASDDRALVRAAVAGDGSAFATLYDRHEHRAFNLAYRITGSREDAADATQEAFLKVMTRLPALSDRDLEFGAYLLTAVRHASYDVIAKARRAAPAGDVPEDAAPVGAASAPPPEEDPDRSVLLSAQQEEIRAANASLAPRQREVLALRELQELSYDEIAERMGMNRNSVAQLISRARIALRDALRRTALSAVLGGCADSERSLPLIALRDDRQLREGDERLAWLREHLAACETCSLGSAAMAEAGRSYRAWGLVPALEVLRRETIARAGERTGHDWSAAAESRRTPASQAAGMSRRMRTLRLNGRGRSPDAASARTPLRRMRPRDLVLGVVGGLLVLLGLLATRTGDALLDRLPPATPAAELSPVDASRPAGTPTSEKPTQSRSTTTQGSSSSPASTAPASQAAVTPARPAASPQKAGRRSDSSSPSRPVASTPTAPTAVPAKPALPSPAAPTNPPAGDPVAPVPPRGDPVTPDPPRGSPPPPPPPPRGPGNLTSPPPPPPPPRGPGNLTTPPPPPPPPSTPPRR